MPILSYRSTGAVWSLVVVLLTAAAVVPVTRGAAGAAERPQYPPTRTEDVVEDLHGTQVADPYRWLEDGSSEEVRMWAGEQDAFTRRHLTGLSGRAALSERLREIFYVNRTGLPRRAGERIFYMRTHADREKAVLYWRAGEDGDERVLLDPNTLSEDGSLTLRGWYPSPDGARMAYSLSQNNADEATLHVMDVESGAESAIDRIPRARYAYPSWTPAGDGFYYSGLPDDPSIPPDQLAGHADVRFHRLGTDPATDTVVREPTGNPKEFTYAYLSDDGHWLFYSRGTFTARDISFRDMRTPDSPWRDLTVGLGAQFGVEAWEDRFYITTDQGAPRWKLFRADPEQPEREQWVEVVAEDEEATLEGVSVLGGHLVLTYLRDVHHEMEIRTLEGERVRRIPLPGLGTRQGLSGEPDEDVAYFGYSDFTTPPEIFRLEIGSGRTEPWSRAEVPVDPSPYVTEQVFFTSGDGTQVPMFVVHRRDIELDGRTPFILTGYGGFSVSQQPEFRGSVYPWLEAGGGYAVANIRGGGEYGEDWHRAGMQGNKQNVFDDFIAAAEYLVDRGYTSPSRLAASGGSNGGLLVGAALTQRPDLFAAVVCSVPLLDMVRYHRFGAGPFWIDEYGTSDRAEDFRWLHAYSPYHRVEPGTQYPAVLFASADSDDRVDPLHARKMAATLQAATGSERPVLFRMERNAGHGGADLVRAQVELYTDIYSFLLSELDGEGH